MRWKLLLRPRWLGLTVLVFTFAALCFSMLGPWQFDRHDERSTQNDAVEHSLDSEPRPVGEVFDSGQAPDDATQWSRVQVTGNYLPQDEVIARLRTVQGEPAYEVLTPMRTEQGQTLLINRGYVRPEEGGEAGDGIAVPDFAPPPSGEVTVTARARMDEPTDERDVARQAAAGETQQAGAGEAGEAGAGEARQVYSINAELIAEATGTDLQPGYFQLDRDQPGVLGALPLPRTEMGPFLAYGLQWLAFGVMALLGWAYFTVRELRPGGALREPVPREAGGQAGGRSGGQTGGRTGASGGGARRKSVAQILAEDEAAEAAGDAGDAADGTTARRNADPRLARR